MAKRKSKKGTGQKRFGGFWVNGGLIIICSMPLVGFLLSRRTDPRLMMAFGLTMVSIALFYMTSWNLTIDFWTLATARMLQGCGLGFLFVPINTVADATAQIINAGLARLSVI